MTEQRAPVLEIQNVTAGYGREAVINNINLSVSKGETFGLIGLNGAGKTTLIKTILALRDQWEGNILVDGHSNRTARSKALTAYLPERFNPPVFLSGNEFVRFSMKLYRQEFDASSV